LTRLKGWDQAKASQPSEHPKIYKHKVPEVLHGADSKKVQKLCKKIAAYSFIQTAAEPVIEESFTRDWISPDHHPRRPDRILVDF